MILEDPGLNILENKTIFDGGDAIVVQIYSNDLDWIHN